MPASTLIIACGALAKEISELQRLNGWQHITLQCLPAGLHNTPKDIPAAVRSKIEAARGRYERIFVAYADCGTGGLLDDVLAEYEVERLPGAHCYEFFAGSERFAKLCESDPGTFYLTDFLVRHFERLVYQGLGLDRHPELLPVYFRNYRKLAYLAQTHNDDLRVKAKEYADRLGLEYQYHYTGLESFERDLNPLGKEVKQPWQS
jgi:hypothetical protein